MGTAYINGNWMPLEDIRISPLDRGFLFGDGVYEVIPVYGREPFMIDRHLTRLNASLNEIGLANPMNTHEWSAAIEHLISANKPDQQAVYLQVTRGVAPRKHAFPDGATPTVFMMSSKMESPAKKGIAVVTMEDRRWLNAHIKSVSLLGSVLSAQHAKKANCSETIMLRNGIVTECSASNVLIVQDGEIHSPVPDNRILGGITRQATLETAMILGITVVERDIPEADLREAEEIWITSSTRDIEYTTTLDGKSFGTEETELFRRVNGAFQQLKPGARLT